MNSKLLIYGAIGFFAIRYFMRQRQTAAAAPIVSLPLPNQSREQQIFDVIPVTPPANMPDGTGTVINRGPNGNNNNSGGGNGNNRAGQL